MSVAARVDAWWRAPAPAARLGALRIVVALFAWAYVTARIRHFGDFGARDPADFQPVGVVALASGAPLPHPVPWILAAATSLAGLATVVGWRHRIVAPLFAALLLWVTSYASSWGMLFHTENLLVLHVAVLALAPAADALALDARRAPASHDHARYGWPIRLLGAVTAATYFVAGIAKLGAPGWLSGDLLRHHVAWDLLRKAELGSVYSPFGGWLTSHDAPWPFFASFTLLVELGAPLALLGGRWALVWTIAAILFHVGVVVVMAIFFPYATTGVAFASFFAVERAVQPIVTRFRRSAAAPPAEAVQAEHAQGGGDA
jgi:hypothetical protein